jgi:choline dehydrogenase
MERSTTRIKLHPFPGFTLGPVHLRPEGRGTVRLKSPDPLVPPVVLFDFLRTEYDIHAMVTATRLCRKIAAQPALNLTSSMKSHQATRSSRTTS